MKRIVVMLLLFSTVSIISGCSGKVIYVPTPCAIKSVDKAVIDTKHNNDILSASKQCARNYTAVKEENDLLRAVIDACRF